MQQIGFLIIRRDVNQAPHHSHGHQRENNGVHHLVHDAIGKVRQGGWGSNRAANQPSTRSKAMAVNRKTTPRVYRIGFWVHMTAMAQHSPPKTKGGLPYTRTAVTFLEI